MTKRQSGQALDDDVTGGLRAGDPHALVEQKLVSAQNYVMTPRTGYQKALLHRAQCIALAHAAGWSKYRIAKRLGITRRAVDEALERPTKSPTEFMATQVKANGGHENLSDPTPIELLRTASEGEGVS